MMVITNGLQLEQGHRAGLPGPAGPLQAAELRRQRGAEGQEPDLGPGQHLHDPVDGRDHRHRLQPQVRQGRDHQLEDLWNPKHKGKVGMMLDNQEIANFGMFALGIDPETSTRGRLAEGRREAQAAARRGARPQVLRPGLHRRARQGRHLGHHGLVGRHLPAPARRGPDLKFVVPQEGGTIWTDNMCIPKTAQNPVDAMTLHGLRLPAEDRRRCSAEYINYITPVPGGQGPGPAPDAEKADGRGQGGAGGRREQPADLPAPRPTTPSCVSYTPLTTAEEQVFNGIFQPITQA